MKDKFKYAFMDVAERFAQLSSARRAKVGAIIVKNDRIISIGFYAKSFFSKLFCFGFASAIFLYIFVNISMVLGLLPIVGSPLPIMSYGGSSMLATMIGFGIVMSSKIYNNQIIS